MDKTSYEFKFGLFGKKVQMFHSGSMGIVIEKEPQVVCIYGTDQTNSQILCDVPLCHPRYLKDFTYRVAFCGDHIATVSVGDIMVRLDYQRKKCANNRNAHGYGSEQWGQDVWEAWNDEFEKDFPL